MDIHFRHYEWNILIHSPSGGIIYYCFPCEATVKQLFDSSPPAEKEAMSRPSQLQLLHLRRYFLIIKRIVFRTSRMNSLILDMGKFRSIRISLITAPLTSRSNNSNMHTIQATLRREMVGISNHSGGNNLVNEIANIP